MENTAKTSGKPVIFSGIQPSGVLTIGNYLGAMKNFALLQDEYECYYCVVDMHSITVRQKPEELRRHTLDLMALYIATGLDPQKVTLFVQSHVSAHAELGWILNCYTYMGELSRMTQFKEKSRNHEDNVNAGLFDYPVLMASDILLYQTDLVPVGDDQRQHLELSRDIAIRFNNLYGDTFRVPEPYIPKAGARIKSLQEPTQKMSKSDEDANASIIILEKPEDILRKVKRAVTDSDGQVHYDVEAKPGISNLMSILSAFSGQSIEEIEKQYGSAGYGVFKQAVADSIVEGLRPVRDKYEEIRKNKDYLEQVMKEASAKAAYVSGKTLAKVQRKVGFVPRPR